MIGLGVYDCLCREISDPETGQIYPALSCCNDKTMADRCTVPNAEKVIWSVKASSQFNSDCAFLLREGFRSGRIRLLDNEFDAEQSLAEIKGFNSLSPADKTLFLLPYIHTTLLIDELVHLQHEESSGKIKIYEKTGMRKDRYSSISYNFYVATQLEAKFVKKNNSTNIEDAFVIKAPSSGRRLHTKHGW